MSEQLVATNQQCPIRMNRIFILDTNVLLHDPNSIFTFKGVIVGIPFIVLEELDHFKKEPGEKGANARQAIRSFDELRGRGKLLDGVPLNRDTQGSLLKVFLSPPHVDFSESSYALKDNLILQTVRDLVKQNCHVTLISKDINARVKADVLGLEAEDYRKGEVSYEQLYKGWQQFPIPAKDLKMLHENKIADMIKDTQLYVNEFAFFTSENNPENYRIFRYLGGKQFKPVEPQTLMNNFGPKNAEQLMALDLLMDDSISLISLIGPAGTGKTFLTLLAGLHKVAYERTFKKFLITRPVVALGADIGYLPGDLQEKLHFWMQPIHDNLEFIYNKAQLDYDDYEREHGNNGNGNGHGKEWKKHRHHRRRHYSQDRDYDHGRRQHFQENRIVEYLQRHGILSLEAITYMRGRSIPYQFVFIDEVQNLTPHEVKTLVSRAGDGTKVILAGDPFQIDSPFLDFTTNGLTVTTEKMKEYQLFGTVFLEKSERSPLAQLAADVL